VKKKLLDLALELESRADDVEVICRRGNKILVRLADGLGGKRMLVGRRWIEQYIDAIDISDALFK